MEENYLESILKQFKYYKMLGERTFEQLKEPDLFWQFNPESNSIAVIVNHLSGNMKSRWTDFLTADGEKKWRNRDQEFEDIIKSKKELTNQWEAGWHCVFAALNSINKNNFNTEIYIRNQGHTIVEAINRQLAHYAYHIGQITFIGRMIKGDEWKSLSIPKGQSKEFNAKKFAQEKKRTHFTDEFLKNK
ncbi:MAG: DUF1572 family protein [Bacteroidota bacterium]